MQSNEYLGTICATISTFADDIYNLQKVQKGCPSIIQSLWNITEQNNLFIVEYFYKHLADEKPKSEALVLAKKEYLLQTGEERAYPTYWACLISIGNDVSLEINNSKNFNVRLILLFIFISLLSFFLLKKVRT